MNNEIPKMYNETNQVIEAQLQCQPCFAITTDLWTNRAVDAHMALTIQYVTETWEMQSWCLGCTPVLLYSDHTADSTIAVYNQCYDVTM